MKKSFTTAVKAVAKSLRCKAGQNTAEYLLMLSIVGVGSIGLLTMFGKQIRNQFAMATAAIGGQTATYDTVKGKAAGVAGEAQKRATSNKVTVGQQDKSEMESD